MELKPYWFKGTSSRDLHEVLSVASVAPHSLQIN